MAYAQMRILVDTLERTLRMSPQDGPPPHDDPHGHSLRTGEREVWRGQLAWLGYILLVVVAIASSAAPALTLLDRPGPGRWVAAAVLVIAAALIARVVHRGWVRAGDRYVLTTAALYYSPLSPSRRGSRARTIPLAALGHVEWRQCWWQKLFGVGNVTLHLYGAGAATAPMLTLLDIPEPDELVRRLRYRLLHLTVAPDSRDDSDARAPLDRIMSPPDPRPTVDRSGEETHDLVKRHRVAPVIVASTVGAALIVVLIAAVVGMASDHHNAATADHMRRVVLPGMAALLNRPVYDRSRPYKYNRTRSAFGCYHCHRPKQDVEPAVLSD